MQAERGVSLYCQRSLDPRYAYRRAGEALPFAAMIGRARVGDRVWSVELGFGTWVWDLLVGGGGRGEAEGVRCGI